MKLHTTGRIICLAAVCSVVLRVQSAPIDDSTSEHTTATDSVLPLTVKPLDSSNAPDYKDQPSDGTKVKRATSVEISTTESDDAEDDVSSTSATTEVPSVRRRRSYNAILRNQRDADSDSDSSDSSSSEDSVKLERKRSADDDSNNGNEETGDDDDSKDNNSKANTSSEEEDDGSTEEASDDPADRRRRRNTENEKRVKRQARRDSNEDEDGGFTREAAIVSPIRRRRAPENQDTDVTTKEPTNYDSTFDPIEDINAGEVSTGTRRRRREADASTVGTLDGSQVIVVAPSDVPVKEIPKALNETLATLQDRINHFEDEATAGLATVPTVGVLAGASTKQDKDTIIHTISSAQYIVH